MEDEQGCDGWAARAAGKKTPPTRRRRGAAPLEQHIVSKGRPTTKTERLRNPCNLQMTQLAISIMVTLTKTHTNKEHRDTNEQAPQRNGDNSSQNRETGVKDRLQSGEKNGPETGRNVCLA